MFGPKPERQLATIDMYVVIFRATVRTFDAEYSTVAARMRELALTQFKCIEFVSASEGDQEIALSYWHQETDIKAWKQHGDHVLAQELGRTRWYDSYSVQVAEITREYSAAMSR